MEFSVFDVRTGVRRMCGLILRAASVTLSIVGSFVMAPDYVKNTKPESRFF